MVVGQPPLRPAFGVLCLDSSPRVFGHEFQKLTVQIESNPTNEESLLLVTDFSLGILFSESWATIVLETLKWRISFK